MPGSVFSCQRWYLSAVIISKLSSHPEFADVIADRGWHAWWIDNGVTLDAYRAGLELMIQGTGVPQALVAHEAGKYLGSALLIEDDLDERPQYSPWIAALWVEPDARRQGVAVKLIDAIRSEAARLGHEVCYLCAIPEKSPYYLARGFTLIESDVAGMDVFSI